LSESMVSFISVGLNWILNDHPRFLTASLEMTYELDI